MTVVCAYAERVSERVVPLTDSRAFGVGWHRFAPDAESLTEVAPPLMLPLRANYLPVGRDGHTRRAASTRNRIMNDMKHSNSSRTTHGFSSALDEGRQRFLAYVVERSLELELRNPADFVRHFSPADIMQGLETRPDLRANMLLMTVGTKQAIGLKKSAKSAGEDLQISLDEGETDTETIVKLFQVDDRVRYLDAPRLWTFVIEPEFWGHRKDNPQFERAKKMLSNMLDRAITDALLSARDIIEGISLPVLVEHLPKTELVSLLNAALSRANGGKPFGEADLLETVPSTTIVEYVPLSHIWSTVIVPKVAHSQGFAHGGAASNNSSRNKSEPARAEASATAKPAATTTSSTEPAKPQRSVTPAPVTIKPAAAVTTAAVRDDLDVDVDIESDVLRALASDNEPLFPLEEAGVPEAEDDVDAFLDAIRDGDTSVGREKSAQSAKRHMSSTRPAK